MTAVACPACALRFARSAPLLCPECERPLVTLPSAEQAVGLRLFTATEIPLAALAAAIAARAEPPSPPDG